MATQPGPVVICDYDPAWPDAFAAIGAALRDGLGDTAERIDHIGSTAVPGLAAKPIIDVQVAVATLEPVSAYLGPFQAMGYVWRDNNPELTKRYFRESPGRKRTHIHVRKLGSWHEQFPLLFRDYLRLHVADRQLYEAVKRQLAEAFHDDRHGYTDAKDQVIWEIMRRADRWAADTGWEPGASDA